LGKRLIIMAAVAGLVALSGAIGGSTHALAYGHADQPLAQLELSGNCNNPAFPLCAAPPDGFGTGGIWVWIEIDANGTGDISGANGIDTVGGGGPAGAEKIKGEVSWTYTSLETGAPEAEFFERQSTRATRTSRCRYRMAKRFCSR
jgi:hypothetical protein